MARRRDRRKPPRKGRSELELEFISNWRILARSAPEPVSEYHFSRAVIGDSPRPPARPHLRKRLAQAGLRDWAFDFAWPDPKGGGLAVEIDGGQWAPGGGRHNTDADREKLNTAAALGWCVMRFSSSMLRDDPTAVIEMVLKGLEYRKGE